MEVRFSDCAFDAERRQVFRAGQEVHLSRKAFDLLGILIASQPRVVPKSELLERLWPETFVVEGNLSNLVAEVRQGDLVLMMGAGDIPMITDEVLERLGDAS